MRSLYVLLFTLLSLFFNHTTVNAQGSCPDGSFQWSDISAIISGAGCAATTCHGGTPGSSGLNMTSYANFTAGGNQCGTSILSGTLFVDIINVGNQMCAGGTINNPMNNLVGGAITTQQSADIQAWIDAGAPEICPATPTCPIVYLNDDNLPTLPGALCEGDLLSLCFDLLVDEATFDPSLVEFNYNLTIGGAPSTIVLSNTFNSGAQIDPNANGQICFETNVPNSVDPCMPFEIVLEILSVFYLDDINCPSNNIGFNLNVSALPPSSGDDLNTLIPLLALVELNPITLTAYPNPNWTATVTQAPGCDGTTLGIIEINAADGTLCETLTDIGTAGMDGCPVTDAILPETLYENFTTFTDADGVEQPNPCAVSIIIPEQTIACEDQCIMCPAVVSAEQEPSVCPDAGSIQFCVTFDMPVDANTVVTVEGISVDGSAGGTQICVDVPFTPPFDPCNGAAIDFIATAICDGTDLLAGSVWLGTQILPVTDPACGGIAGCMDDTACNYNPMAVCDDPAAPCLPAPTCNIDPCLGDVEIVDPNDPCQCIIDQPQVLGCTDAAACNYDMAANCDDGTCDLGNTACSDPCNEPNPDDGCDLTTDTFDAATCTVTNEAPNPDDGCDLTTDAFDAASCMITNTPNCAAGETFDAATCMCISGGIPGCLDQCDPYYDPDATIDDPTLCLGYDTECNSDCLLGDITLWDPSTCFCEVFVVTVLGCTDSNADNYDPVANCDDGSCMIGPCEDMIAGSVITDETGCSPAGIEITIYDDMGTVVGAATTDASGNYALMGLYPCGDYTAELTANIPSCYSDSGGIAGPIGFTVNGDGTADGATFIENPQVPTLSQWGLIILALLLMNFGALRLSFQRLNYLKQS